jgi:hypothetical protein
VVHGPLTPITEEDEQNHRVSTNFFEFTTNRERNKEEIQDMGKGTEEEDEEEDFDIKKSAFMRTKTKKMVRNSK